MKYLSYIVAIYIAIMMALSQIEGFNLEIPLLIGFNLGGVLAFTAAGIKIRDDATQGYILLVGAFMIRGYTYFHIYYAYPDQLFWTMTACNSIIAVFELAIFFSHSPKSKIESMQAKIEQLKAEGKKWEQYAIEQEKLNKDLNSKLEHKSFSQTTTKHKSKKRSKVTSKEKQKAFILENKNMSRRDIAEQLGVSVGTQWSNEINSPEKLFPTLFLEGFLKMENLMTFPFTHIKQKTDSP